MTGLDEARADGAKLISKLAGNPGTSLNGSDINKLPARAILRPESPRVPDIPLTN